MRTEEQDRRLRDGCDLIKHLSKTELQAVASYFYGTHARTLGFDSAEQALARALNLKDDFE